MLSSTILSKHHRIVGTGDNHISPISTVLQLVSSKKEDHIVVEVAVEVVKVVEEVVKVVEEVMMVVEVEAVKEVAEVVEEVEVEEAAEVAEMAPHPPTKLTRRSRRRIDSSETVKSLTMSNSLKSPPELHRCVLSQGRPN